MRARLNLRPVGRPFKWPGRARAARQTSGPNEAVELSERERARAGATCLLATRALGPLQCGHTRVALSQGALVARSLVCLPACLPRRVNGSRARTQSATSASWALCVSHKFSPPPPVVCFGRALSWRELSSPSKTQAPPLPIFSLSRSLARPPNKQPGSQEIKWLIGAARKSNCAISQSARSLARLAGWLAIKRASSAR